MQKQVDQIMGDLFSTISRVNFSNSKIYGDWLTQQYFIVRHSTPLLALSCGLSLENREYHLRCIEHLQEEKGHDKMIVGDLKKLGYEISDFPEKESTKPIYQSQYFWIEHVSPISFLGYVLYLESLAVVYGQRVFQMADSRGATFLRHHHDADTGHLESAYKIIQGMGASEQKNIRDNLNETGYLYSKMLEDLAAVDVTRRAS